jgi:glycerophosphoryl diester phosphodiesterase
VDLARGARPWVLGHRGAPRARAENTLASFAEALRLGADGVELDVRRTQDQVLVVHHDPTIRVRGRRRRIANLPKHSLPARIPTLDAVLEWARDQDVFVDVELKEPGIENAVADRIRASDHLVVTSFYPDILFAFRERAPHITIGWITKAPGDAVLEVARSLDVTLVVLHRSNARAALTAPLLASGTHVWAWGANTPAAAQRLVSLGVSALITDEPGRMVRWRDGGARPRTAARTDRRGN